MNNVTLKKLAELLGLSAATVSRALNDSYEISQKTKDKVNALAKELNYEPNPFASSLRQHKSKTIALIIPEISSIFFSQVTKGVEAVANHQGYHVIICCSDESHETEKNIVKHLISGRVDGILLSAASDTFGSEHLDRFIERKIPVVLFDRVLSELQVSSVTSNDYESSFSSTEHLIRKGCKKIAFFKLGNSLSNIEKRYKGYKDAMLHHSIEYKQDFTLELSN
ncbi:LacI family transcriptional regulator, partial [Pseudoxanthomonas sp. SGD-10]